MKKQKIIIVLYIFLFISSYSYAEVDKYRTLFFPDGIGIAEGWDKKMRKMVYEFYSEVQLFDKRSSLVLYSVKTITGNSDDLYKVYLSIISKRNNKQQVITTENVTKYFTVFTDVPGNFYKMDGIMDRFKITDTLEGIHVNLWSVLSGSGSISSTTDLLYMVKPNFELKLLLAEKDSSTFSKVSGNEYSASNTYLYYEDTDGDKITEILIMKMKYEVNAHKKIDKFFRFPQLRAFHFNGDAYVFFKEIDVLSKDISKMKKFNKSSEVIYPKILQTVSP